MRPIPPPVKGGKTDSSPDPPALPTSTCGPGDNSAVATTRWRGRPFRRKCPTWQGPRVAAPKFRRWRRNSRERGRSMDELRVAQERELKALQRATEMGRWPRRNWRSASAGQRQNAAPERRAPPPEPQRRTARRLRSRSASMLGVGRHEHAANRHCYGAGSDCIGSRFRGTPSVEQ